MSRVRRLGFAISKQGKRANVNRQALALRNSVLEILREANQNTSISRIVTKRAAFTVILRSLNQTKNLPFSLREHIALKELSQYITLAQSNKSNSLTLSNTDLLPISHPRSTRDYQLTASASRLAKSRWYADDPRISDLSAKSILASAFSSKIDSMEHIYYTSLLSGLPQGTIPTDALLAAFGDGNSSAARSWRAQKQRRDREGKFAYQGGGLIALVRRGSQIFSFVGRTIADGLGDLVQIELGDGRIAQVPGSKGEFVKAVLPSPDGFSPNPVSVSTADMKNVINESDIIFTDSPEGWTETKANKEELDELKKEFSEADSIKKYADGAFDAFVVKDKEGNRDIVLKTAEGERINNFKNWADVQDALRGNEEELAKPKARLPEQKAKKESKFSFNYPDGAYKIAQGADYDPEGPQDEQSPDFTDDPAELAQRFEPRELIQELEQAVLPQGENENAFGYGALRFNRGDELVPAEAIYKALDEAGEDADLELARIYDKGLGSDANEKALLDARKGPEQVTGEQPDIAEAFERVVTENTPDVEPAAEEPAFVEEERDTAPLPPLLEGLSENELARFMEGKDHTPFLPKNFNIADEEIPEGYNKLNPEPYLNWKEITEEDENENLPVGFSDNPVFLSQNISKQELLKEYRRALEPGNEAPGYGAIKLQTDDGEEFVANVPGEAIRDALQLQGVDTDMEAIKIYAEAGNLIALTDEDAEEMFRREREEEEREGVKARIGEDEIPTAQLPNLPNPPSDKDLNDLREGLKKEDYLNDGILFGQNEDNPDEIDILDDNALPGDEPLAKIYKNNVLAWRDEETRLRWEERFNENLEQVLLAMRGDKPTEQENKRKVDISKTREEVPVEIKDPPKDKIPGEQDKDKDKDVPVVIQDPPKDKPQGEQDAEVPVRIEDPARKAELPTPADKPENKEALDAFKRQYVKDLLNEEEALADKFEEEGMTRSDAQSRASAEMNKKYGKDAFQALQELPRKEALRVLAERIEEEPSLEGKKVNVKPKVPKDFEENSLAEVPDGFEEYPQPANVEPAQAAGGGGGPFRIKAKVKDLQPGDITVGDHFVITKIGEKIEGTNRVAVEGYYPGHVIQNTKQWIETTEIEVIRGIEPLPEQGDLAVLSKPKMKDFGKVYKDKADNQWKLRDPDEQAAYDAAWAEYVARAEVAKKKFADPTEPSNNPHRAIVRAADLKPGDVTSDPDKGHFVIERVFTDENTPAGKVSVEGYYPGYGTQRKEWKVDTQIDVIRNVEAPEKGEGELHRPTKEVKGKWIADRDPEKNAAHDKLIKEAGARWNPPKNLPVVENKEQAAEEDKNIPTIVVAKKPSKKREPDFPAFQGAWADLVREAGGDMKKLKELLKDKEIIVYDFETTGVLDKDGNEPWQVAGLKIRNGEIVDRINIYMNPGRSLKDVWAGQVGKDGKPNAVDADGNPLSDEYLQKQISQAEGMKAFFDWVGPDALMVAHYIQFDDEVARRMAEKHGLNYAPGGMLDTKALGKDIFKNEEVKPAGNRLGDFAEFLGVKLDNWHAADADVEALAQIFNGLIEKGIELDAGKDALDVDARIADYENALAKYKAEKAEDDKKAADFAAAKALKEGLEGKEVNVDNAVRDAKNVPALDPEGLNMGPVDAPIEGVERREDGVVILDFTPNAVYPKGEMRMMPRDWVVDDKNTVMLDREDIRMRNLLPGDFMPSKDGNIIWQVTAIRAGEDNGFQPGRVRVYRRDIENGEMNVYENWHGLRLDGVRRAINPADLEIPEGNPQGEYVLNKKAKPESEETPEAIAGKQFRKVYQIGDKTAVVKLGEKDLGIFMEAELFDAEGNSIYKADGQFRTFAGAEAEADALIKEFADGLRDQDRKEKSEPEEARAKDVPISRGDVPADAYDAPETIEVEELPADFNGQISIRETGQDAPNYEADAVLQNADGENLAEHHSEHPTKPKAETEARNWVARALDAILQGPSEGAPSADEKPEVKPVEKKKTKTKKELPQDQKVRFSQLNEEEQAEVLRNNAEVEAIAVDMRGIRAGDVKPGDFIKHRQLNHWEKIVRVEIGKEWGMNRVIFWVYNPVAGKEQPRPFEADSPLEFVRRIEGDGPVPKFPVGKPRGRAKRPDIRRQVDPLEQVKIREGRVPAAIDIRENRGFFNGADGEPVLKGDIVVHSDPVLAKKLGRGIVKRRIGDQVDEGKKVGGMAVGGKARLDYVWVQWENEDAAWAIEKDGGRKILAKKLRIVNDNPDEVLENVKKKSWKGGVVKPNRRGGINNPYGPAAPAAPEAEKIEDGMVKGNNLEERKEYAREMGRKAFARKAARVPANEINFYQLPDPIKDQRDIMRAWLEGYDQANIEAELPDAPQQKAELPSSEEVRNNFMLQGSQYVRDNGVKVAAKVREVAVGDFVMTRKGKIGRVVNLRNIGDRVAIEVEYRGGQRYEYKPYRKDLQMDGIYRIPTKDNPLDNLPGKSPTPPAPAAPAQNVGDVYAQAESDLRKAKKGLPKLKDVYGNEQNGLRSVNAAYKALKARNVGLFDIHADRAIRRLERNNQNGKYQEIIDKLEKIKNNVNGLPSIPKPKEPVKEWNGPADLNPAEVAEARKNNGQNPFALSPFWQDKIVKNPGFWRDLEARYNVRGTAEEEEIRSFFADGKEKPLAELSPKARVMLSAVVAEIMANDRKSPEEIQELANIVDLDFKLRDERLAYEPNRDNIGAGQILADLDIKELDKIAPRRRDTGVLNFGGKEWFVKRLGEGGGRAGDNRIFKITDVATGESFFYKQDEGKKQIDSEIASAAFLRAFGAMGAVQAIRHNNNERVVITSEAGENLKLAVGPRQAHEVIGGGEILAERGPVNQALAMAMIDALIHNTDRHMNNYQVAKDDNQDVEVGRNFKYMPLLIDQGLGRVFEAPNAAASPFDYMKKNMGLTKMAGAIKDRVGPDAFYELIQRGGQQALQALRRDYPVGTSPEIDILVGRLEQLLAVPRQDWR